MTDKKINKALKAFIAVGDKPDDDELNAMGDIWQEHVTERNPVRGLHCRDDFMMGMIIMAKRLLKE